MASISEIKARNNIIDYARNVLGWDVRSPGDHTYSIDRGSNDRCLWIYDDWFYDFKLGAGGDVIDLCALARHGGDRGAAIRELGGHSHGWREETQNLCNAVALWHKNLRAEDWEYLRGRRLTDEYVKKMRLGFDGARLTIPYYKNGYVAYVITRERGSGGPKYKKAHLDGMMENIPWGLHTLDRDAPLVIAEGAFDAMSFDQEGYRVLSPISGFFNRDSLRQALDICRHAGNVFICFDSDSAGSKFQTKMAQEFFKRRIDFTCGELTVKDVSDYYCAGGKLDVLMAGARPGIEVLAERIEDRGEFKKFVMEAGRFVGRAEMMEFLEKVRQFPPAWMREVTKQALSPPSEDSVVKEIVEARRLKFFEALGFYEYSGGAWRKRGDAEIKRYVSDAMGHYRTGSRVGSVFSLLKGECVSTEQLDRKPVFNFRNGTLELETGAFREHREADLSSIQAEYEYDPEAFSAQWAQFIEEICEGDECKENLLQEVAGYVLFNDCSLQKCFFLLGDGANGKSVFLDVLAATFGPKNVSNVEMSGLAEPFQRIRLYSSILNVSSETQTDVKGAESVFKQLVVGDAVNGCYKGRDFVEFRTRAKFISACNDYITSRDVTTGFLRRICFINFNARFVDEPGEGEHKADRELSGKLAANLPGVFNWAYAGYRILREARQFSAPNDQKETQEDFARSVNPIMSFIEDEVEAGEYERGRLYNIYADWCGRCGHMPLSRTAFVRRFKATMAQAKRKVREFKTNRYRGFVVE